MRTFKQIAEMYRGPNGERITKSEAFIVCKQAEQKIIQGLRAGGSK